MGGGDMAQGQAVLEWGGGLCTQFALFQTLRALCASDGNSGTHLGFLFRPSL